MIGDWRAVFVRDPMRGPFDTVKLYLVQDRGRDLVYYSAQVILTAVQDGMSTPSDAGIDLPGGAIEAIATALQEFQGHASHADTEASVLREWLAVERGRVDQALAK